MPAPKDKKRAAALKQVGVQLRRYSASLMTEPLGLFAGDEHGRQVIAARIIDLASTGVIDAKALRDRVLREARTAA